MFTSNRSAVGFSNYQSTLAHFLRVAPSTEERDEILIFCIYPVKVRPGGSDLFARLLYCHVAVAQSSLFLKASVGFYIFQKFIATHRHII